MDYVCGRNDRIAVGLPLGCNLYPIYDNRIMTARYVKYMTFGHLKII